MFMLILSQSGLGSACWRNAACICLITVLVRTSYATATFYLVVFLASERLGTYLYNL